MVVNIEQIQAGIVKYIDTYLAPKATGLQKFAIYFITPSIPGMIASRVNGLKDNAMFSDFFDESGNIKLDDVYNRAQDAIRKSGKIYIDKLNYFADEQDLQMIYNFIKSV